MEEAPTKSPLSTRKIQFSNSNLFNFNLISIFSLTLGLFALLIARSKISDVLVSNKSSRGFPVGSKETEDFHSWPRLRYLTLVATNLPHPPARLSITNTTHLHHHFFILCPSANRKSQISQVAQVCHLLSSCPSVPVAQIAYCATSGPPAHVRCFYSYKMLPQMLS